jgi:thiamine pyrophosphate-dependent acetolactate synthase large subunit-like protein
MAQGMGVAGECVTKPDEVAPAVARAFAAGGPRLVEVVIEGKR